ncbi:hypothetical protein LINPERHAP1_LOCUS12868, partial [Linum perenne]
MLRPGLQECSHGVFKGWCWYRDRVFDPGAQFWHLARPGARTGVYLRVPASSGQAFFILLQPYLL